VKIGVFSLISPFRGADPEKGQFSTLGSAIMADLRFRYFSRKVGCFSKKGDFLSDFAVSRGRPRKGPVFDAGLRYYG